LKGEDSEKKTRGEEKKGRMEKKLPPKTGNNIPLLDKKQPEGCGHTERGSEKKKKNTTAAAGPNVPKSKISAPWSVAHIGKTYHYEGGRK